MKIREFALQCQNGKINTSDKIKVYIPSRNILQKAITTSGYGNKTYYDQETYYPVQSADFATISDANGDWKTFFSNGVKVIAEISIDGFMDKQTLGIWSISKSALNGIIPSSIPSTTEYLHKAQMKCDKYVKNTYVVDDGIYYFGAHTERASALFKNLFCVPSLSGQNYTLPDSKTFSKTTANYSNPQQKAYYAYLSRGWTEYVNGFDYGGNYFSV